MIIPTVAPQGWYTGTNPRLWDYGVTWRAYRSVSPTELPASTDDVLRALRDPNEGAEDELTRDNIVASTQACEDDTQMAVMPQTWKLELSGFPSSGEIHVPRPPFIEVVSLAYQDGSDVTDELAVSPVEFQTVLGGSENKTIIRPLSGASFPSTYSRPDAVTLTYRCGFEQTSDPRFRMLRAGIIRMATEMSQIRGLSVQGVHNTPALLDSRRFWKRWIY